MALSVTAIVVNTSQDHIIVTAAAALVDTQRKEALLAVIARMENALRGA